MIILGIETSCDETAVSVVEGKGRLRKPIFRVRAHVVSSQTAIHAPWGGVVPILAKREHGKNLIPVLKEALEKSKLIKIKGSTLKTRDLKVEPWKSEIGKILEREPELLEQFLQFVPIMTVPKIDAIAVTYGPGLEPALWAGLNFARALAHVWQKPLIPVNHMEGHIYSVLVPKKATSWGTKGIALKFPVLALLISGGHTELVLVCDWFKYQLLGATRDDAVGEAFDKVARLFDLPYPGGPALSKLAKSAQGLPLGQVLKGSPWVPLPRPMLNSPDFDFSFSGLKTAALYRVNNLKSAKGRPTLGWNNKTRATLAADFEQAVIDVLLAKSVKAIEKYLPQALIIAGGVSANQPLRKQFTEHLTKYYPKIKLLLPELKLSLDNATMIAVAGYLRFNQNLTLETKIKNQTKNPKVEPLIKIRANGNLTLN